MKRLRDLNDFYSILDNLEAKVGKRLLANCDGKMNWPLQGVYFFFENGEVREANGKPRVVRVGTHGVSINSKTSLWNRLRGHRGSLTGYYSGGGNHRGSIFRLHIGTALLNKQGIKLETWGKGASAKSHIKRLEHPLEMEVSQVIRAMPFLWVKAEDTPGPKSIRKLIEKNTIGLLSNFDRTPIDAPSDNWLGNHCENQFVRKSGLWNVEHVTDYYDDAFLDVFDKLVRKM